MACWMVEGPLAPSAIATSTVSSGIFPDLYEASVAELQAGLDAGTFTGVDLVKVRDIISLKISSSYTYRCRLTSLELTK